MAKRKRLTPEQRLANYWRRRSRLDWSDFDIFDPEKNPPKGTNRRPPPLNLDDREVRWEDVRQEIGFLILKGFPLNYQEYHIATAVGYLMGELPYEVFFKKRWGETAHKRGYTNNIRELLGV